jgi:SWI/SNF-related matrix-associated actin-dependent regulator of chromatin subfamily D
LQHTEWYSCLPFLYLGTVLGIKEESRLGVVQTLWNYIKVKGLQDKDDRRLIRADDKLRPVGFLCFLSNIIHCSRKQFQIFGLEPVIFQKLPEIVNRYLAAPDPIVLHYNLNPAVPPPDRPSAWDVELKIEDSALKNRMAVTVNTSKESAQALLKLDEEVCFLKIKILLVLDKNQFAYHINFLLCIPDRPPSAVAPQFAYETNFLGIFC